MGSSIHKDLREEKEWGNVIKIQCQKESTTTKEAKWHRQRNPKEKEEYQRKHAKPQIIIQYYCDEDSQIMTWRGFNNYGSLPLA